jgi:hypothetical protein
MGIGLILVVIGAICFFVDAAKVPSPLNLFSLGWGFVIIGTLVVT